jgi:soluble lytic murein transglycosylase-like protein
VGPLKRFSALLALLATPAYAGPIDRWAPYVEEASVRFAVPPGWIVRVIEAESGGRASIGGHPIRSRVGAMGLMQLMPATWSEISRALGLGPDPDDPRDNILAGSFYLRRMFDRFGYPGLFAAYQSGPARYSAFLAGRSRLPDETAAYLARVGGEAALEKGATRAWEKFAAREPKSPPGSGRPAADWGPLFVKLGTAGP